MALGVLISLGLATKVAAVVVVAKIVKQIKQSQSLNANKLLKKDDSQESLLAERKEF